MGTCVPLHTSYYYSYIIITHTTRHFKYYDIKIRFVSNSKLEHNVFTHHTHHHIYFDQALRPRFCKPRCSDSQHICIIWCVNRLQLFLLWAALTEPHCLSNFPFNASHIGLYVEPPATCETSALKPSVFSNSCTGIKFFSWVLTFSCTAWIFLETKFNLLVNLVSKILASMSIPKISSHFVLWNS